METMDRCLYALHGTMLVHIVHLMVGAVQMELVSDLIRNEVGRTILTLTRLAPCYGLLNKNSVLAFRGAI